MFRKVYLSILTPIVLALNTALIYKAIDLVRSSDNQHTRGYTMGIAITGVIVSGILAVTIIIAAFDRVDRSSGSDY